MQSKPLTRGQIEAIRDMGQCAVNCDHVAYIATIDERDALLERAYVAIGQGWPALELRKAIVDAIGKRDKEIADAEG